MQHRRRDGRGVDATLDVLTLRPLQVDIEYDAREPRFSGRATGREAPPNMTSLRATISGLTAPDSPEDLGSQSSAFDAENIRRFSPPNMLCSTTCSDKDSHGVSDPSGQARGHVGRAQWGRSRHGFLL